MIADRPLAGIRVTDLSRIVSGPLCGRLLADLGADVIKVEAPEGDYTRVARPEVEGVSTYYAQLNAGKRDICLDLKVPAAVDALRRLVDRSDVLVENFRPGVLDRLGLGPATLRERNARLIVCSVTGWGQSGPWSDRKAYAPRLHAEAGTMEMIGRLRGRMAEQEVQMHGDIYAAVLAAGSVLAALFQRERTGLGQHIDLAMAEAMLYVNEWAALELLRRPGSDPQPEVSDRGGFDVWRNPVFLLADGTQVAMMATATALLPDIIAALHGDPAALDEKRFDPAQPAAVRDTFARSVIGELLVAVPDVAALESIAQRHPQLNFAELRSIADLAATPWAAYRGLTAEVLPGLRIPAAPWRSDAAEIRVAGPPPRRGEHGREVLREAGVPELEIDRMYASGAVLT